MTGRAKDEEHMPNCAALRCQRDIGPAGVPTRCKLSEQEHHGYMPGWHHDFHPGPCSCILGELRAEVERLNGEISNYIEDNARKGKRLQSAINDMISKEAKTAAENDTLRAKIERLEKENARLKEQMIMNEDWLKE